MEKQFYSGNEAAELCGVSRQTIARWIQTGKLHAQKVGRTYVIPVSELAKCTAITLRVSKEELDSAVRKVVSEYKETLDLLAKE